MDNNIVTEGPSLLEAVEQARRDRRGMVVDDDAKNEAKRVDELNAQYAQLAQERAILRTDARTVSLAFEQFILDHTHEIEPDDWAKLWAACGVLHQLVARNRKR